jgi:mRNA interferase MazF
MAPLTTRIRGIPVEVAVGPEDGVSRWSVVNLDEITTIRISTLGRRITTLSADKMDEVNRAIRFALALA